jgi:hypothetical protein
MGAMTLTLHFRQTVLDARPDPFVLRLGERCMSRVLPEMRHCRLGRGHHKCHG